MKIVYLDQNKWIELARALTGKTEEPELRDLYLIMKGARDRSIARFPLSLGHYMETHRHASARGRQRLAVVMNDLSEGMTLCDVGHVLRYEIDCALLEHFPKSVRPDQVFSLNLLGSGVQHASGYPLPAYRLPDEYANRVNQRTASRIEGILNKIMQECLLSEVVPFEDEDRPQPDLSGPSKNFQAHLDKLHKRLHPLDQDLRHRTLHAMSMVDIIDPLKERMTYHGVLWEQLGALGPEGLCGFIASMPTRRVDVQLHSQWAKNRYLRSKQSDLNDWAFLGCAAMYCDVLVTEKQFADLVQRDGFETRATILTDLRGLSAILLGLS